MCRGGGPRAPVRKLLIWTASSPPNPVHTPQIGFTRGTTQHAATATSRNRDRTHQTQRSDTSNARVWLTVAAREVAAAQMGGGRSAVLAARRVTRPVTGRVVSGSEGALRRRWAVLPSLWERWSLSME